MSLPTKFAGAQFADSKSGFKFSYGGQRIWALSARSGCNPIHDVQFWSIADRKVVNVADDRRFQSRGRGAGLRRRHSRAGRRRHCLQLSRSRRPDFARGPIRRNPARQKPYDRRDLGDPRSGGRRQSQICRQPPRLDAAAQTPAGFDRLGFPLDAGAARHGVCGWRRARRRRRRRPPFDWACGERARRRRAQRRRGFAF